MSLYFRSAEQYLNQISVVNGKKQGTDINLYKLFVEQCLNLLSPHGECGLVIPSGIYTDLGTKQLREMLFSQTKITGLFCFENKKAIFEGVHKSFKFVVLTFQNLVGANGHSPLPLQGTISFPAKFMRHDVGELNSFPDDDCLHISVDLIKQLSPDSISIMEFKSDLDILIAEKMSRFPLLGEEIQDKWNLKLTREFDMTNDSHLFKTEPGKGRLPLYEGKIFNQFNHNWGKPKYWLDEQEAAQDLLSPRSKEIANFVKKNNLSIPEKTTILLDYQSYRLAFRDVTATTNERSVIMTVLPPNVFCPHTVSLEKVYDVSCENGIVNPNSLRINSKQRLFICALVNSFIVDYFLRKSITNHVSFFYVYQTPVPRLTEKDAYFQEIVERAAKLICTTPEYDELAKEVGLGSHKNGITDERERGKIRAELDGIIAHLYGLTEGEFSHILSTFPIVAETVKDAALKAYRDLV
ncbi:MULTISPECIES: Eco57I restriction-modification methylase domain-containing protein [Nostocales]|uniref:Eco57I restriction-modification methylase domain-containing protein n=1 Tax=Nostocales TaxID=1161 RepID=UPI00197A9DC4|nr:MULTISPECIES: Eco57I restriction-modification methylase domain-containing protein [Nostocales]